MLPILTLICNTIYTSMCLPPFCFWGYIANTWRPPPINSTTLSPTPQPQRPGVCLSVATSSPFAFLPWFSLCCFFLAPSLLLTADPGRHCRASCSAPAVHALGSLFSYLRALERTFRRSALQASRFLHSRATSLHLGPASFFRHRSRAFSWGVLSRGVASPFDYLLSFQSGARSPTSQVPVISHLSSAPHTLLSLTVRQLSLPTLSPLAHTPR